VLSENNEAGRPFGALRNNGIYPADQRRGNFRDSGEKANLEDIATLHLDMPASEESYK
jgi:hypothetical protein